MKISGKIYAYTLMEILVVITIVSILVIGASQLNIARLSQSQQLSIETVKILSILEEIKNNALVGKSIDENGNIPLHWRTSINSGSNNIRSFFHDGSDTEYTPGSWNGTDSYNISRIECFQLDNTSNGTGAIISVLFYVGGNTNIMGCPGVNSKIIKMTLSFGNIEEIISINTLNGVIERE